MKMLLVAVLGCAIFICARAEDGVKYTPPPDRISLWENILPTLDDIPDKNFRVSYDLFDFEGCEFKPSLWGHDRNTEKIVTYWAQYRIGRHYEPWGKEGEWRLGFGLISKDSVDSNGWFISSVGLFAKVFRTF